MTEMSPLVRPLWQGWMGHSRPSNAPVMYSIVRVFLSMSISLGRTPFWMAYPSTHQESEWVPTWQRGSQKEFPDHGIQSVIAVPDSGRIAALELARVMGVPYREGFVKNRYIGRTFIMPGQNVRKDSVRKKLNTIEEEFSDKVVLIVDDSVVREILPGRIVAMARRPVQRRYTSPLAPPDRPSERVWHRYAR